MAAPRGYWTQVFDEAGKLLKERPELSGDVAYWMARRKVDSWASQPKMDLDKPADLELQS